MAGFCSPANLSEPVGRALHDRMADMTTGLSKSPKMANSFGTWLTAVPAMTTHRRLLREMVDLSSAEDRLRVDRATRPWPHAEIWTIGLLSYSYPAQNFR